MQLPVHIGPTATAASTASAAGGAGALAIGTGQARFKIVGSGPFATRTIEPVGDGARTLLAAAPPGAQGVLHGVLRLLDVAGAATSSAQGDVRGIALALDARGHDANEDDARLDGDRALASSLARMAPGAAATRLATLRGGPLGSGGTDAHVVAGWLNLGPRVTSALLTTSAAPGGAAPEEDVAHAVRVLRHEAQHLADATRPAFSSDGTSGLREALAETASTTLPALRAARGALGLDAVVGDAALARAASVRPYRASEEVLLGAMHVAGLATDPHAAHAFALRPSREVADELARRLSVVAGVPLDRARTLLDADFAAARREVT